MDIPAWVCNTLVNKKHGMIQTLLEQFSRHFKNHYIKLYKLTTWFIITSFEKRYFPIFQTNFCPFRFPFKAVGCMHHIFACFCLYLRQTSTYKHLFCIYQYTWIQWEIHPVSWRLRSNNPMPELKSKLDIFSEILLLPGILGFPIPTLFFWKINGWNTKSWRWIESGIFRISISGAFKFQPWIFGAVSLGKSTRNPSNNLWRGLVSSKQDLGFSKSL